MFKLKYKKVHPGQVTTCRLELLEPRIMMSADPLGLPANELVQDTIKHPADPSEAASLQSIQGLLEITPVAFSPDASAAQQGQEPAAFDLDGLTMDRADYLQDGQDIREIVFIDTGVPDYQAMLEDLLQGERQGQHVVYLLDGEQDGIDQIRQVLGRYADIDAIHLISHGNEQGLQLGSSWLTEDNLAGFSENIRAWGDSLSIDADLLIYGCNLAASEGGLSLIDTLGDLTGADVAASDDLTGHARLGGDWELEYSRGDIETDVAFNTELQEAWGAVLVNSAPTQSGTYDLGITAKNVTTVGQQVSTILSGITVSDPDGDTLGIAVRSITALGNWQYSVDSTNGSDGTWDSFGAVNPNAALLLDESTWVRYVPDGVNAETATFAFSAWDQTADTASGTGSPSYGDLTPYDPTGAYGNVPSATVTLLVSMSNPPTVDLDAGAGGVDYAFTFNEGDGATIIVDATVDVADADDTTLVNVTYDTGGVVDGAAEQLNIGDLNFALNAADFTNAAVNIGGNAYTVNWVNATGIATITLNSGEMTIAQAEGVMLASAYQHTDTVNPTDGIRTIDIRVNDGDADSAVATSSINVVSADDAININTTGNTVLFTEDAGATTALFAAGIDTIETTDTISQLVLTLANVEAGDTLSFGATNVDLNSNGATGPDADGFTYTVSSAGASPVVTITHAGTDDGTVNAMLNSLVFNNTTNDDPSTTARTVTLTSVTDSGSGTTLDGTVATVNVVKANDAPTLGGFVNPVDGTNEDTEVEISLADLAAQGDEADVDGTVNGFVIKSVSSGTLRIGASAATAMAYDAATNNTVNIGNNAYWTPGNNANGAALNAFTAVALDDAGAESSPAQQVSVDVNSVNDEPSGANNTVSLIEDANYVFAAGDFGFTDPADGDALAGVIITTAPTKGSLSLTGSGIVTDGQLINIADINAGKLVFTPDAGDSGSAYAAFSFQVVDSGGTAIGGINTDQTSNTMTMDVVPSVLLEPPPEPEPPPVIEPPPEPEPEPPVTPTEPDEPAEEEASAEEAEDTEDEETDDETEEDSDLVPDAVDLDALAVVLLDTITDDNDNSTGTVTIAGAPVTQQSLVGSIAITSPALSAGLIPTIAADDEGGVTDSSLLDEDSGFNRDLDRMKESSQENRDLNTNTVGTAVVVTTGITIGYLVWLIRAGVLLSSVMSALPAWRLIDPLPVLTFMLKKKKGEDDESLETMVESEAADVTDDGRP